MKGLTPAGFASEARSIDRARSTLLTRSALGAKWTVVLSGLSAAITVAISVLLGRIGSTTLGFYTIVLITVNAIVAFFFLGGENVVIYFLPRSAPHQKAAFLTTYAVLVLLFAGSFFLLAIVWPPLLRLLLDQMPDASALGYTAFLLPAVILHLLVVASLRAEMDLKGGLIAQSMVTLVTFVALAVFATGSLLQIHEHLVITLTVLGAYLISATYGVLRGRRIATQGWRLAWGPYLPSGFWRFCLPFHLSTIVYFFLEHADQLIVLRLLGIADLGLYKAALVVAQVVPWLPMVLMRFSIYPTLANLSARGDRELMERVYGKALALACLWTSLAGVWLLLLAPYLMRLFGRQLATEALLPAQILVVGALVASPFMAVNGAYLLAQGRTTLLLSFSAAGAVASLVLGYLGTARYGVVGSALGHAASVTILVVVSCLILWWRFGLRIPGAVLVIPLLAGTTALGTNVEMNIATRLMTALVFTGLLAAFAIRFHLITKEDVLWVWRAREPR